jgi:hypothetical protein
VQDEQPIIDPISVEGFFIANDVVVVILIGIAPHRLNIIKYVSSVTYEKIGLRTE